MNVIRVDNIEWNYRLNLLNNSSHAAYNIGLVDPQEVHGVFSLVNRIDSLRQLLPNSEVAYDVVFQQTTEGTGKETSALSEDHPQYLLNNKFKLEYKNVSGSNFYTIYDGSKRSRESK